MTKQDEPGSPIEITDVEEEGPTLTVPDWPIMLSEPVGFGEDAVRDGVLRTTSLEGLPEHLREPPTRLPATRVRGHGTVHRGRTRTRRPDGTDRDTIWIWIHPDPNNDCGRTGTYRWYQFVRVRFFLDGQEKSPRPMEAATGREFPFGEWTADYHPSQVMSSDPAFSPNGLDIPANDPGKPYMHNPIPGTSTSGGTSELTGVMDSPEFTDRGNEQQSPIERLTGRFIRPKVTESPTQPSGTTTVARIEVEARSYLVCIRDGQAHCIGYVSWSMSNEATIRIVWREEGIALGGNRRWRVGSEIVNRSSTLTIGDWTMPC